MKYLLISSLAALCSLCFACSSAPEKAPDPAPTVNAAMVDGTQSPVMMPFTLTLSASDDPAGSLVVIDILCNENIRVDSTLTIEAQNGELSTSSVRYRRSAAGGTLSKVDGKLVESLPPAEAGTHFIRQVILSGDDASVTAKVSFSESGLSFEMREVWPPEPVEEIPEIATELDNPIEVNGAVIERSINIAPKRPTKNADNSNE